MNKTVEELKSTIESFLVINALVNSHPLKYFFIDCDQDIWDPSIKYFTILVILDDVERDSNLKILYNYQDNSISIELFLLNYKTTVICDFLNKRVLRYKNCFKYGSYDYNRYIFNFNLLQFKKFFKVLQATILRNRFKS